MEISKCLTNWPVLTMLEPEFISKMDMLVVHGSFGTEALILTQDRMVYALGSNNFGSSGLGRSRGSLTPRKIDILCEQNIKTFAHGSGTHVLALTENGKVYSWGNNTYCQLGNKSEETEFSETPAIVQENLSDTFVVDIACGCEHSLALTGDGEVYEWGENNLMSPTCFDRTYIMPPRKVQSTFDEKRIVCICCGESFSMAVTADGEVFGWGNNESGQLGIGNYENQEHPCKITELTGIAIEKVFCGVKHTLALSKEGILYTWGSNAFGQLGCSMDTKVCHPVQLKIPLIGKVLDIAATHYHNISVAMGEGNRVFVWGNCRTQDIKIPTLTPYRCLYDALASYTTDSVMHKPLLLHTKGTTNLTDCLGGAFDDPTTSDLTIQVEGSPIYVHKAILKIRCQYFRTMFQDHWVENNQSFIEHEQYSYDVYNAFLKYLYTNEINVSIEDALEFLDLTNAYSESQLRSHWIQLIKKDITVKYAIPLYNAAILYNAKELEEYCFQFAINHMTAVVRTPSYSKLDESKKIIFKTKAANAGISKTLVESYQNLKTTTRNLMKWKIIRSLEPKFISKIHVVSVRATNIAALFVTKDGIVYGVGINRWGFLGTGDTSDTLSPIEIKALSGKGIKTFVYALDGVLALTEEGEVYSWGPRYSRILGYEPTSDDITPTLEEGFPSETMVVDLASGIYHSLALTNAGKVYAWGENTHGQLDGSSSPSIENVSRKVGVIFPGKTIVYIRCCSKSSIAVTDGGEVYSWGCNKEGELGRGDYTEAVGVHKVQIPAEVVIEKIACGSSHTLALSNKGVLYVWGANTYGQLGLGHRNNACTPIELQVGGMERVLDVAASHFANISVAMCEHSRIFVWGRCLEQNVRVPTRVSLECLHDAFAYYATYSGRSFTVSSEEEMSITDDLRHAFDDVATSDLTIHVEGKSIYVHKDILKLRSQHFRILFQEQCAEKSQSAINHEQFCYDVYRAYLAYLYTDEINMPAENFHELLDLAATYSDNVLRDRCIPLSKYGMKVDNVSSIFSICIKHNLEELKRVSFEFLMNNLDAVVRTPDFSKLDACTTQSLIIETVKARAFKR